MFRVQQRLKRPLQRRRHLSKTWSPSNAPPPAPTRNLGFAVFAPPSSIQVETLDRRAFTARALVLRQLVLCVYRLMVLSLFGLVLLATHFAAIGVSRNLGPNLIEASGRLPSLRVR